MLMRDPTEFMAHSWRQEHILDAVRCLLMDDSGVRWREDVMLALFLVAQGALRIETATRYSAMDTGRLIRHIHACAVAVDKYQPMPDPAPVPGPRRLTRSMTRTRHGPAVRRFRAKE